MDDQQKLSVFLALKLGQPDDQIIDQFDISEASLRILHQEYKLIQQHLEQINSIEEISRQYGLSQDYLENARHIIETDPEILKQELSGADFSTSPEPKEPEEPDEEKEVKKPLAKQKPKGKGGKGNTKNIEQNIETSGVGETAEVLIKDVGDIAKSLAIERQELGKWAMESHGTIAAQYGYTNLMMFMEHVLNFWIENQGKIREMEETIEEYTEVITQLKGMLEIDIAQVFVDNSIERVLTAALMGGGSIDIESLDAYKHLLTSDPNTRKKLKKLLGQYNDTSAVNKSESNTVLNML